MPSAVLADGEVADDVGRFATPGRSPGAGPVRLEGGTVDGGLVEFPGIGDGGRGHGPELQASGFGPGKADVFGQRPLDQCLSSGAARRSR